MYALAGVTSAELSLADLAGRSPSSLGVGVGLAVGLVNGLVVTRLRINALIATLAMSFVVSGLGTLITHGNLVVLFDHPEFQTSRRTHVLGVTTSSWIAVIAVVVIGVLLARTTFGRYIYATGGNAEAARLAGVRVDAIRVVTFVVSGGAAAPRRRHRRRRACSAPRRPRATRWPSPCWPASWSAAPASWAARAPCGARSSACLFIALIGNGYDLLGLDPLYEQITLGVILLAAVAIDAWARQRRT